MSTPEPGARAEFRAGWAVLLACTLGFGFGTNNLPVQTSGAFLGAMTEAMGWSRGDFQLAGTFQSIGMGLSSPLIGWLCDRYDVRRIVLISTLGAVIGYAALTLTTGNVWSFYGLWFLSAVLGAGTMPITYTKIINAWFDKGRGLALGVSMMAAGLTGSLGPLYVATLIENFGWRAGYLGLAALPLILSLPAAIAFLYATPDHGPRRKDTGPRLVRASDSHGYSFAETIRQPRYWILVCSAILAPAGIVGLIANFVPILTDAGWSLTEAAGLFTFYGLAVLIGRVGVGFLLDRYHAPLVGALALSGPIVSCLILMSFPQSLVLALIAGMFIGLAGGAEFDLLAFFTSRYFGMKAYGRTYGLLFMLFQGGAALGPAIFGFWYDAHKNYDGILYIAISIFLGAAGLLLMMGKAPVLPGAASPDSQDGAKAA